MADGNTLKTFRIEKGDKSLEDACEAVRGYLHDFIPDAAVLHDAIKLLAALERHPESDPDPVVCSRLSIILNNHLWQYWYYEGIPFVVRVTYWAAVKAGMVKVPEQFSSQWNNFVAYMQTIKAREIAFQHSDMAGGWLFPGESHILWEIARLACDVPGDFCELGTWTGRSATILCAAVQHFAANKQVLLVDNWAWGIENEKYPFMSEGRNILLELEQQIRPYSGTFRTFSGMLHEQRDEVAAALQDKGLALLFHDAGHDFDQVSRDLEAYLPLLSENGYLAVHDYNHPDNPDVKKAVDSVARTTEFSLRLISVFNTIALFRKGSALQEDNITAALGVARSSHSANGQ